jgi:hypothetical protein
MLAEIAVEIVTTAEPNHRDGCLHQYEWRVQRKAQLEEELRQHQLVSERQERERRQRLERARIDRRLDEAASLRRSEDIRAYVQGVKQRSRRRGR